MSSQQLDKIHRNEKETIIDMMKQRNSLICVINIVRVHSYFSHCHHHHWIKTQWGVLWRICWSNKVKDQVIKVLLIHLHYCPLEFRILNKHQLISCCHLWHRYIHLWIHEIFHLSHIDHQLGSSHILIAHLNIRPIKSNNLYSQMSNQMDL